MSQLKHLKQSNGKIKEFSSLDNFYSSGGKEIQLLEIDYSSISNQSLTIGNSYELAGKTHSTGTVNTDIGAAISIVNSGLQLTHTNSGAETWTAIEGSLFSSILNSQRCATGRWAISIKVDWGTIPSNCFVSLNLFGTWPSQYYRIARARNIQNQPNTNDGGIFTYSALDGTEINRSGGTYNDHNVMMIYTNYQNNIQFFTGKYNSEWPDFEELICQGYVIQQKINTNIYSYQQQNINTWRPQFLVGGTSSTFSPIIERFRITTYE